MSATINAFPAVHAFNSSRSWAMAIIVLLHVGFFWVLTSGLSRSISVLPAPRTEVVFREEPVRPRPERPRPPDYVVPDRVFVPQIVEPLPPEPAESTAPRDTTTESNPSSAEIASREPTPPVPVVVEPEIDPRLGLSEPLYPSSAIRENVEGTVILWVQVLENGRVGEVRIEQSSGDKRLDESAQRQAKRWRLVAGTRDGVPVVLWKQIPVTFQLRDARR
jgi:protein TonB